MIKGRIHSFESMGLVDGPGVRSVIFMQGCSLRCRYCHNPDTWKCESIKTYTPSEIVEKVERYKPYFKSGGGVTFSGGEPLLQPEFLIETLKMLKEKGINTCIDTAGYGYGDYDEILKYTDLVLYDVKHYTKEGYKFITSKSIEKTEEFLKAMIKNNTKMWIRHVVVPGITDSPEHIKGLRNYIQKIPNVLKVQLLPYHTLGVNKYEKMKIKYALDGVKPMDKEVTDSLLKEFFGEY